MDKLIIKRKIKKEYEQFTCRIEVDLIDKLREISKESNISINEIISECIKYGLNNVEIVENCDEKK